MRFASTICLLAMLATSYGCMDLSTKRKPLGNLNKVIQNQDAVKPKDLSKMTTDQVIKTKYKSLVYMCSYEFEVNLEKDGAVETSSPPGKFTWDIVNNTFLTKEHKIDSKILNLTLSYLSNLKVNLDSRFNVSIEGAVKYDIKTYAADGTTILTSNVFDGTKTPYTLQEGDHFTVLDLLIGPANSSLKDKIKMDCSLTSIVRDEYK